MFPSYKAQLLRVVAVYLFNYFQPVQRPLKPVAPRWRSLMWSAQAQTEGLTLLVADNKAGYYGVYHKPGKSKPYQAQVWRGGKPVSLGYFATAEEAALYVARTPEGQKAAERPAAAPPLTSEEARQQAQAEGLTLLVAENATGYFGVSHHPGKFKPYQAAVRRCGKNVYLGRFATAEEAALYVARTPEGQEAAERPAAAPPLTSEEVRQQAQAEKLTLLVAENTTGYFGVCFKLSKPKPYMAQLKRAGKQVHLGCFATAEEAALCVARSPEGREAAERPAAAPPLTSEEARQQAQAEGLTLLVAETKAGYFGVYPDKPGKAKPYKTQVKRGGKKVYLGSFTTAEEAALCVARSPEGRAAAAERAASAATPPLTSEAEIKVGPAPMPSVAFVKEDGVIPPMPPDAFVKVEVVVKEEQRSGRRPKRQKMK